MNPSTTIDLTPSATLADLALALPGAVRVFHRHGLDYCCHGRRSLAEACAEGGLELDGLVAELRAAAPAGAEPLERWDDRPLGELIDHILAHYHEPHREDVARLIQMAHKVEHVHAEKPACPRGLAAFLEDVAQALEEHMQKEEQVLFPLVRAGRGAAAAMPVHVMEMEHEDHGRNLERLRALTTDYTPPEEACTTWRALYQGLAELEREIMQHIHLENHVLFPRALRS